MVTDKTIWECPVYTLVSQLDGAQRLVIQSSSTAVQDNSVPISLLGQWMAQNNNISIYNGSSNPDNALGNNGDLYFQSNSKIYQKLGGVWVLKATGSVKWGAISGTLSDQTDLQTALNAKVDKAVGFGLSSNDYTSSEKSKLAALSEHYVGYYVSLSALNTAHPSGLDGQYATVDAGIGLDALNYIWDDNDTVWVKSGGAGTVTSVNSQTGAVILTTDNIGEGSTNKYFTVARVLASALTAISFGSASAVLATDNILQAIGKLQAQITALFFAGGPLTGYSSTAGGALSSSDTILTGLEKLEWNINHIVSALLPTAVKSGTYAAVVNDFIPFDTTGGNGIANLPSAPADQSSIGVKHVTQGGANTVTINCGGTDKFNKTGGSTSLTLSFLNQGMVLLYKGGIWYVVSDDLPIGALDTRYLVSPALTGTPTAPTAAALDNSTKIATTAYVDVAVAAQAKKTIIGSFQSII